MSVVRLWPAEKAYYIYIYIFFFLFFFRVFQANEREREASEEHHQTRHTRDGGMHLPQSRKSGAPRSLRTCPRWQVKGT